MTTTANHGNPFIMKPADKERLASLPRKKPKGKKHTIRTSEGGTKKVSLTRSQAIKVFCTECLGWEGSPKYCESTLCPLYPFRGGSRLAFPPGTKKSDQH